MVIMSLNKLVDLVFDSNNNAELIERKRKLNYIFKSEKGNPYFSPDDFYIIINND